LKPPSKKTKNISFHPFPFVNPPNKNSAPPPTPPNTHIQYKPFVLVFETSQDGKAISGPSSRTFLAEESPGIVDELNPEPANKGFFRFKTIQKIVDNRTFRVYTLRIMKDRPKKRGLNLYSRVLGSPKHK